MFRHVLLAVDFSPAWPALEARAAWLQKLGCQRLTLMHVLSSRYPAIPQETHRHEYEARLSELASSLGGAGLEVEVQVRTGEPGAELVQAARDCQADLLLIGSRGHGRFLQRLLGSTALDAARLCTCPVWFEPIRDEASAEAGGPLLLATDGSEAVAGAEALAMRLAPHFPDALAVTATCASEGCEREVADAEAHLQTLATSHPELQTAVLDGDAFEVLERATREHQAALIVVGKRGRSRIKELLLGSTAEALLRQSQCPVLLVPAG